jgi:acetamidase/formamidase
VAEYHLGAAPTHSVWDNLLEPRLRIAPGDIVHLECQDASGGQLTSATTSDEFQQIDKTRIHALTGPIAIDGAGAGDVLEVQVLHVEHVGWGWTSLIPGLGFLDARFKEPYLFQWQLEGEVSRSLAPATVPLRPFCGVMGVAQAEGGATRTRPPGAFGGNMDVRQLSTGATLYLPVQVEGALFSAGDPHAAQGDGEVCINGIECPANISLRFLLHKGQALAGPLVESAEVVSSDGAGAWMVVESAEDPLEAARVATSRMIDLLIARWGFAPEHAYILCSVAMDLKLSQVVNRPMTTVSASLPKSILPARKLF